ncbi:hypothetical protein J2W42_005194 [Rhizobium tibeticum]|nr:hypothetical protein [Rhizobium tibeticum]
MRLQSLTANGSGRKRRLGTPPSACTSRSNRKLMRPLARPKFDQAPHRGQAAAKAPSGRAAVRPFRHPSARHSRDLPPTTSSASPTGPTRQWCRFRSALISKFHRLSHLHVLDALGRCPARCRKV